jgi:hypothetical protein
MQDYQPFRNARQVSAGLEEEKDDMITSDAVHREKSG